MAYFNEFPHTRTFDSDLAWLIDRMKDLLAKMDGVDALMEELKRILDSLPEDMRRVVIEVLNQMLLDGEFELIITSALQDVLKIPYAPIETIPLVHEVDFTIASASSSTITFPDNNTLRADVFDLGGFWCLMNGTVSQTSAQLSMSVSTSSSGTVQMPRFTLTSSGKQKLTNYRINSERLLYGNRILQSMFNIGIPMADGEFLSSFVPEPVRKYTSTSGNLTTTIPSILTIYPKRPVTP